jgi:predicted CxxxxCH...CXXCH cytochrome family protein
MRPDVRLATAILSALTLAACAEPRPSAPGGGVTSGSCTACHGDAARVSTVLNPQLPAAPPKDTSGNSSATAPGVGAHQAHLNDGTLRVAMACTECHTVPGDTTHATQPLQLTWGPLATTQGAAPNFNATSLTCSSTYCHGSTLNAGGTLTNPVWISGASQVACGSCHSAPPPSPHPQNASCGTCHPGYTATTVNVNTHVNGTIDVSSASCSTCHGDAARAPTTANPQLPAAPPVAPAGSPAAVVGTHQLHLNDSAIRQAVACASCHVVPTDGAHSGGVAQPIQFSGLATTQGVTPTYNAAKLTCSATYCHGNFNFGGITGNAGATAAWDATPNSDCKNCHLLPPAGHPTVPGTTAASCSGCHPQTVNSNGTINVASGAHINGDKNQGAHAAGWADPAQHGRAANAGGLPACTSCHVGFLAAAGVALSSCNGCHGGTAWQSNCTFCHGTSGRIPNLTGTDALLAAAPPVGTQGETLTSQAGVGAHQAHVNPTSAAALATPFACAVCHPSPLPIDITHVDGSAPSVVFTGAPGSSSGTYNGAANPPTCSSTYCHGATLTSGSLKTPSWIGGASQSACGTCHSVSASTIGGRHNNPSDHAVSCNYCHGTGFGPAAVNAALHVNGTLNVGGAGTLITSWNSTTTECSATCHTANPQTWR